MGDVTIHIIINSKYRVFDCSGSLPFSIVFGLCRRSRDDADPRPLVMRVANSILDVPYALSCGLLKLYTSDAETRREIEVAIERLSEADEKGSSFLTLPSPVGREGNWRKHLLTYEYYVDPNSKLASLFQSGREYTVRCNKALKDLGGKGSTYVDQVDSRQQLGNSSNEELKLVCERANGRATFTAASSLHWPPKIQTRMQWRRGETYETREDGKGSELLLEITVLNTGAEAVTVQTSGSQYFLALRGPMGPDLNGDSNLRTRIIDAEIPNPIAHIQVVDTATNAVVREPHTPFACTLHSWKNFDPRPKLGSLLTLKPGEPLIRCLDISKEVSRMLSGLPDSTYGLRMAPRGMWWCPGSCEDFETEGEDRVPRLLFKRNIPPLMLECEDVVELQVENGVVGSFL